MPEPTNLSEPMFALDTKLQRVGVVMDRVGGRVQLRPQGGGLEWEVHPEHVQRITATEAQSLRDANTCGGEDE